MRCARTARPKRRAYRTVLDTLFHALVRWLAPVLVFTSEEVWGTRFPDAGSVHLLEWPDGARRSMPTSASWVELRDASRPQVTEAIEPLRRDKILGLEPRSRSRGAERRGRRELLAELFITSTVHQGDEIRWRRPTTTNAGAAGGCLPEVPQDGELDATLRRGAEWLSSAVLPAPRYA